LQTQERLVCGSSDHNKRKHSDSKKKFIYRESSVKNKNITHTTFFISIRKSFINSTSNKNLTNNLIKKGYYFFGHPVPINLAVFKHFFNNN